MWDPYLLEGGGMQRGTAPHVKTPNVDMKITNIYILFSKFSSTGIYKILKKTPT